MLGFVNPGYVYGYHGLGEAFVLLQQALEKFGDSLYPALEEGEDKEWKVIALTGLNGENGWQLLRR